MFAHLQGNAIALLILQLQLHHAFQVLVVIPAGQQIVKASTSMQAHCLGCHKLRVKHDVSKKVHASARAQQHTATAFPHGECNKSSHGGKW
eukprot:1146337-Pelagomonas_calceolata.AAC.3